MRALTRNQALLAEELERLDPDEQCAGYLRLGDKMCVHGVVCDLYMRLTGRGAWVRGRGSRRDEVYAFELDGRADSIEAPGEALEFFDVTFAPVTEADDVALMHENDNVGASFADLARMIRTCPGKVRA